MTTTTTATGELCATWEPRGTTISNFSAVFMCVFVIFFVYSLVMFQHKKARFLIRFLCVYFFQCIFFSFRHLLWSILSVSWLGFLLAKSVLRLVWGHPAYLCITFFIQVLKKSLHLKWKVLIKKTYFSWKSGNQKKIIEIRKGCVKLWWFFCWLADLH